MLPLDLTPCFSGGGVGGLRFLVLSLGDRRNCSERLPPALSWQGLCADGGSGPRDLGGLHWADALSGDDRAQQASKAREPFCYNTVRLGPEPSAGRVRRGCPKSFERLLFGRPKSLSPAFPLLPPVATTASRLIPPAVTTEERLLPPEVATEKRVLPSGLLGFVVAGSSRSGSCFCSRPRPS